MTSGSFITFEGGEGSGKSTQARRLCDRLAIVTGKPPVLTREPGGTPFAEQVRALILSPDVAEHDALAEALLFYSARADHIAKVIGPAVKAGRFVLCDRFSDSTRVYQSVAGGLPRVVFDTLETLVVGPSRPDLTFVFDIDPALGLARAEERRMSSAAAAANAAEARDKYERRDLGYHRKLRDGFLDIARSEPSRCVVIDAARAPDVIANDVWQAVEARLLAKG